MTDAHPGSWPLLDVEVPHHLSEIVADTLWSLGVAAIEEVAASRESVTLRTSVGDNPGRIVEALSAMHPEVQIREVSVDRAVADTWREFVELMPIDDGLVVVPAWKGNDQSPADGDGKTVWLLIEPGHTFGLGNHATTRATLRAARRWVSNGARLHDHGCGSGILALAMMKTHNCVASVDDIAEGADEVVAANAQLNGLQMPRWCANGLTDLDEACDVIVANILAPVLREHSGLMEDAVRPGGLIIISGLRREQRDSVTQHFERCDVVEESEDDGWLAIVLRRREKSRRER